MNFHLISETFTDSNLECRLSYLKKKIKKNRKKGLFLKGGTWSYTSVDLKQLQTDLYPSTFIQSQETTKPKTVTWSSGSWFPRKGDAFAMGTGHGDSQCSGGFQWLRLPSPPLPSPPLGCCEAKRSAPERFRSPWMLDPFFRWTLRSDQNNPDRTRLRFTIAFLIENIFYPSFQGHFLLNSTY